MLASCVAFSRSARASSASRSLLYASSRAFAAWTFSAATAMRSASACFSDVLVPVGLGLTDLTETVLLGHALLGVVDGLGGGFLTEGLDVAGLVADIGDVDVDEFQTDLAELGLDVLADGGEELVAVGVDLLDIHGSDDQTELSEEDIGGDVLDVGGMQSEQTLSSIGHDFRLGGDTDSEAAGDVDADILLGQCVGEVALDADGSQVEHFPVLENRPDEGCTAVDASGGGDGTFLVLAGLSVDDEDLVGRTPLVTPEDGGEGQQEPDGVIADGDALAEPDGRVAEVAEDEGGGELEQVMAVQDLAAEDHLREDEHQVHHPGQGADGEEAPAEVEHGRRAGNRGGSEVGFEGQGDADGDEDEAEGRDSVPFEYVFCAIIHIFANWTAGDKAVRKFAQKSVNKQRI